MALQEQAFVALSVGDNYRGDVGVLFDERDEIALEAFGVVQFDGTVFAPGFYNSQLFGDGFEEAVQPAFGLFDGLGDNDLGEVADGGLDSDDHDSHDGTAEHEDNQDEIFQQTSSN